MPIFTLTITLGNDAMSDAPAIAEALRNVADTLDSQYVGCDPIEPTNGEYSTLIWDANGSRVGQWAVSEPERAETIAERVVRESNWIQPEDADEARDIAVAAVRIARGKA